MKIPNVALIVAMLAMSLTDVCGQPPAEDTEELRVAQVEKASEPCPTEIEVQPYIWIEPETGYEYRVLHLHCPGEDDG